MANTVPDISFDDVVKHTTSDINVDGYFTDLMVSINKYVQVEFEQNRITGSDYSQVYLGALQYALEQSISFALNKHINDQQAELLNRQITQQEIINAELPAKAAAERRLMEAQRDLAEYELAYTKPAEYSGILKDNDNKATQQQLLSYELLSIKPAELQGILNDNITKDYEGQLASYDLLTTKPLETAIATYNKDFVLPAQVALSDAKKDVELKQLEVMDSQISLYGQQAEAFEYKHRKEVAKIAVDAFTVGAAQDVIMPNTGEVFGHNIRIMLEDAKWPGSSITT